MTRHRGSPIRRATSWFVDTDGTATLVLECGHHAKTTWQPLEVPSFEPRPPSKACKECP